MTTPSEEAKQAAEAQGLGSTEAGDMYAMGFDAATAKLRDENTSLRMIIRNDGIELSRLRKELALSSREGGATTNKQ